MITFLIDNWLWIGLIALFVAMHRGGHGCGMHGSHSSNEETQTTDHANHHSKT